ncbi:GNAT family N-acetyltransferase [Tenacibaculum ascidiaceicola]|uniref:GNAT family N-acetyltransferase n=1 Tax=Tenacibaculum ascidiaceicola TaxID=1699411 RepID=UPI0039E98D0D
MIKRLNNKIEETSLEIQKVFRASYKIEAKLLNADDFPPLKREVVNYMNSDTEFYGFWKNNEIAAIIEVESSFENTDIHSLVVHPNYFRQGLGKQLTTFVLNNFNSETYTVETGAKNIPAIKLYKQLGFEEQKQWDTEFGIRKVGFIKTNKKS